MPVFLPNIPQPSDNLDFSQGQLLANNQSLDSVFGIDHTLFSDATVNKGFHNKVTSIPQSSVPTTTTNPVFYGYQQTSGTGVLQFTKGPNDAAPTALTCIQSQPTGIPLGPSNTAQVMDFTGLNFALITLYAFNNQNPGFATLYAELVWTSLVNQFFNITTSSFGLHWTFVGNNLKVVNITLNPMTSVYFAMRINRMQ